MLRGKKHSGLAKLGIVYTITKKRGHRRYFTNPLYQMFWIVILKNFIIAVSCTTQALSLCKCSRMAVHFPFIVFELACHQWPHLEVSLAIMWKQFPPPEAGSRRKANLKVVLGEKNNEKTNRISFLRCMKFSRPFPQQLVYTTTKPFPGFTWWAESTNNAAQAHWMRDRLCTMPTA